MAMNALTKKTFLKSGVPSIITNYDFSIKTPCMSSILTFLGIDPDSYDRTSNDINFEDDIRKIKRDRHHYLEIMESNGIFFRDISFSFGLEEYAYVDDYLENRLSLSNCIREIKKSGYDDEDLFIIIGVQKDSVHGMLFSGCGDRLIDTYPNSRWYVEMVIYIPKKENVWTTQKSTNQKKSFWPNWSIPNPKAKVS